MAVHARPAAFEGADERSYTVAIETDETGERDREAGAAGAAGDQDRATVGGDDGVHDREA